MTNYKKRRLIVLGWTVLLIAYALGVAAAWTGTKTDTASSLAITAVLTAFIALFIALASLDG